jgi:hypothetical protein
MSFTRARCENAWRAWKFRSRMTIPMPRWIFKPHWNRFTPKADTGAASATISRASHRFPQGIKTGPTSGSRHFDELKRAIG